MVRGLLGETPESVLEVLDAVVKQLEQASQAGEAAQNDVTAESAARGVNAALRAGATLPPAFIARLARVGVGINARPESSRREPSARDEEEEDEEGGEEGGDEEED